VQVRPEDSLRIENIVALARLGCDLDLSWLSTQIPGAEYKKKRFPGVIIKMNDPKMAALVFASGKVILTGARNTDDLDRGLTILGNQLRRANVEIPKKLTYTIQNIVTSADLGVVINLIKIAVGFNLERIEYEPEQFPGLVYRMEDPKVVLLLFGSGKIIIAGGKQPEDAKMAVIKIISKLQGIGMM
jgi:transcription initiation factor TFIID TATA-box-binding protein